MLEANLIRYVIIDILSSQEYSLAGLAYHINCPEDVIYEIAMGINTNPSLILSERLLELHRLVRPDMYLNLIKKSTFDDKV